jgi:hypothetical protein
MKTIFLFFLMVSTLFVDAQKKIINLSFKEFYNNKQFQTEDSTSYSVFQKNIGNQLPYIQYIHFLNNDIGIGVQLSYQRTRLSSNLKRFTSTPNYYNYSTSFIKQDAYIFSFSIHEKTNFRKYTLLNGLYVPIELYSKSKQENIGYSFYNDNPNVRYNEYKSIVIGRPAFATGLFYQFNLNRKVWRGINANIALNAGVNYLRYYGYTIKTDFDITNNISTTLRYKTSNTYQINPFINTTFGISYLF